jgi:cytochrome P450
MLLAGEDTTANTIAWMIYLLSRHPSALARAAEEVRRVLPDPQNPTHEQVNQLAYVEACAHTKRCGSSQSRRCLCCSRSAK